MTNLGDQRQATLGASYSIDRQFGGGRTECATSLGALVWSGHYEGLECRLKLGAHVDVSLHPQAGAEGGRCSRGAEPAQRAS